MLYPRCCIPGGCSMVASAPAPPPTLTPTPHHPTQPIKSQLLIHRLQRQRSYSCVFGSVKHGSSLPPLHLFSRPPWRPPRHPVRHPSRRPLCRPPQHLPLSRPPWRLPQHLPLSRPLPQRQHLHSMSSIEWLLTRPPSSPPVRPPYRSEGSLEEGGAIHSPVASRPP